MNYSGRRDQLWESINREGLDAFLIISVEGSDRFNLRYLTGFTGTFGILILAEKSLFATDSRYTEQAESEVPGLPIEEIEGQWLPWLADRLRGFGLRRVGIGAERTTVRVYQELSRLCQGVELVPLTGRVEQLRLIKDEEEVEKIARAARLADQGLGWIVEKIQPGMTEREVALMLEMWYRQNGAEDVAFELIVAFGPNSSMPHHRAGDRRLAKGDLILFDIGTRVNGYCSDLTRVMAQGRRDPEAVKIHGSVLAANRAGIEAVRAGAAAKDVDWAARAIIADAGYGEKFGHGLGHGVGLEVHEGPRLAQTADEALAAGMVTTVEPGVYLPGRFGVRIEDLLVVGPDGRRVLSSFPRDLLVL